MIKTTKLLTVSCVLMIAGLAQADMIVIGDTSSDSAGNTTSLTFSHVLDSGSNRVVVAGAHSKGNGAGTATLTATYGGISMNKIDEVKVNISSGTNVALFYLEESELTGLSSGASHDLIVSRTGGSGVVHGSGLTLLDVMPGGPTASNTASGSGGSLLSASTSITTTAANSIVADIFGVANIDDADNTISADSGQTVILNGPQLSDGLGAASYTQVASAGSTSVDWSWTDGGTPRYGHVVAAFRPIPEPASLALVGLGALALMRRRTSRG